jgi:Pyridoxamine 5'-phosphate oxidase
MCKRRPELAPNSPFVTPIWFVVGGDRVVMATGEQSVSAHNLRVHPEAVLLFEADRGGEAASVLRLRGPAVVRPGFPSIGVLIGIAIKYYVAPGDLRCELANLSRQRLRRRYYAQSQPAVIEMTPYLAELLPRPG